MRLLRPRVSCLGGNQPLLCQASKPLLPSLLGLRPQGPAASGSEGPLEGAPHPGIPWVCFPGSLWPVEVGVGGLETTAEETASMLLRDSPRLLPPSLSSFRRLSWTYRHRPRIVLLKASSLQPLGARKLDFPRFLVCGEIVFLPPCELEQITKKSTLSSAFLPRSPAQPLHPHPNHHCYL